MERASYPSDLTDKQWQITSPLIRSDDAAGFVLVPRRWIVERIFAWWGDAAA